MRILFDAVSRPHSPQAAADSQKAASRAHRREPPASRQPPPPTIADSDVALFGAVTLASPTADRRPNADQPPTTPLAVHPSRAP